MVNVQRVRPLTSVGGAVGPGVVDVRLLTADSHGAVLVHVAAREGDRGLVELRDRALRRVHQEPGVRIARIGVHAKERGTAGLDHGALRALRSAETARDRAGELILSRGRVGAARVEARRLRTTGRAE